VFLNQMIKVVALEKYFCKPLRRDLTLLLFSFKKIKCICIFNILRVGKANPCKIVYFLFVLLNHLSQVQKNYLLLLFSLLELSCQNFTYNLKYILLFSKLHLTLVWKKYKRLLLSWFLTRNHNFLTWFFNNS
jgi:hypothetical protein